MAVPRSTHESKIIIENHVNKAEKSFSRCTTLTEATCTLLGSGSE
jgi:hypothetical protein